MDTIRSIRRAADRRRSRGQALVEFTVVIPVFLALLMGVFDLGRVVWAQNALDAAAREAARFAIVHGSLSDCPVGPLPPGIRTTTASCPFPVSTSSSPSTTAIRDVAAASAIGVGGPTITVCYGDGCTGDTDSAGPPPADNRRGTAVTVTVSSTISLAVPSLLGIQSVPLSATCTMLVNH